MIREVTLADIPECVKVIRRSFQTVADEFGFIEDTAPRFTAFATTEERLQYQFLTEHRPMAAFEENGRIIGYYSLSLRDARCELNNLAVLPVERHKGIGEALLRHAFAKAKMLGCTVMEIGIVEENQALKRWYEKFGFTHIGTKKFDFFPFTCGYLEKEL